MTVRGVWRAAGAAGVAVVGIGLSLSSGVGNFSAVSDASHEELAPRREVAATLPKRLVAMHDSIAIRAEQEPAWQRFAGEMTELEALTRAYERRVASGERVDTGKERASHALIFGAAINEIDANLSSEQTIRLSRLSRNLAGSLICRSLAN